MPIRGIEGLSEDQIRFEIDRGARFVVFEYCISVLLLSFRRCSDVFFVRPHTGQAPRSWPYTLMNLLFGWWGLPWGPIFTIGALAVNLDGGRDVTEELLAARARGASEDDAVEAARAAV